MSVHDSTHFPPGTHMLDDQTSNGSDKQQVVLNPTPSDDPDDPLNWTTLRKSVNFGLTSTYVLFTFVLLEISSPLQQPVYVKILGFSMKIVGQAGGASYAGLALGCILFVPCVHKFGRRPVYLISALIQFISAIWNAKLSTSGEWIFVGLLSGIGGSTAEAIVLITIVDLFFVHQHARMNGIFLFMQSLGALGGPIAGGFIVNSMNWRWVWWITAICLGVNLILVIFAFEESKYVPRSPVGYSKISKKYESSDANEPSSADSSSGNLSYGSDETHYDPHQIIESQTYPRKSYWQRMALWTKTDGPILHSFYRPFIVPFMFPAILFTAFQYGMMQAWFGATTVTAQEALPNPPYNFKTYELGLFNLGGFIGVIFAALVTIFLSDWLVIKQARRNGGIFEPEMRLWLLFPAIICVAAGSLLYGIGLSKTWAWYVLAIGNAIFGFGFMITSEVALSYLTDCYPLILNDALISVVFMRNLLAACARFPVSSWITGMGIQNMFILIVAITLATLAFPVLFILHGKRIRIHTEQNYTELAATQLAPRPAPQKY
ncbi:unnamed protein product [Penicillium manginii]